MFTNESKFTMHINALTLISLLMGGLQQTLLFVQESRTTRSADRREEKRPRKIREIRMLISQLQKDVIRVLFNLNYISCYIIPCLYKFN
jgi:hypothetical protein